MAKIYLSNWSSHRTKGCHGLGKLLSIMVRTPDYVTPDGIVPSLTPRAVDFSEYKAGKIDINTYRERFFEKAGKGNLEPGKLVWNPYSFLEPDIETPVADGDTLCCVCSKKTAANSKCHRAWVAVLLFENGWDVVLDGEML